MRWTLPGLGSALLLGLSAAAAAAPPGCNGIPLLGTPEEIAATPREDVELERLSVEMSGGLTADQAIYDRVTRDIGRIRAFYPETSSILYDGWINGQTLLLGLDEATRAAIENGTYSAWDCLNDYYGLPSTCPPGLASSLVV